ncbi:hypothetical protein B0H13DRAFT_2521750 [Mycena leptocephala]|nr:hypothetical protein B0H13DRAFT_2521750 [Mycena leptocephala]
MQQHSTPQCRLALAENCSVLSARVSSTLTHITSPAPPTHLPPHHRPYIRHARQRSGRSSIPPLSPRRLLSTRRLALVVLILGRGSEHTAKASGWTGTRSPLELAPVRGKVARRWSLTGNPFMDVPSRPSLQVFLCRDLAHGALKEHSCCSGYRSFFIPAFLLPESERESPPTRHSRPPVSSRMVRHRRCSTACRLRAHLLPGARSLHDSHCRPHACLLPWPPLPHDQHGSSLADCARGSKCIQNLQGRCFGVLLHAWTEAILFKPPSTRSIVCRDYHEYFRHRASIVRGILWTNSGRKPSAGFSVKVGL